MAAYQCYFTKNLFFFFVLLFFKFNLSAQQPVYFNYTTKDGLPSNTVYTCFQDSKGYMWFGTDRGVARFDGYKFTVFTTSDGLADNVVFSFYEDSKNRIWFSNYNGNPCYYHNGVFYSKANNPVLAKIEVLGPGLKTIEDKNKNIFILTHFNLYKITDKNEIVSIPKTGNELYSSLNLNAEKEAIVLSSIGILNATTNTLQKYKVGSICAPLLNSKSIFYKDKIYFSVLKGLTSISIPGEPYQETAIDLTTTAFEAQSVYLDIDNQMLIGFKNGLVSWNPETQKINSFSFDKTSISGVVRDHEHNLWISSLNNGIYLSINPKVQLLNSLSGLKFDKCNYVGVLKDGVVGIGSTDFNLAFIKDNNIVNLKLPTLHGEGKIEKIRIGNNGDYYITVGSSLIRVNKQFQTTDVIKVAARDVLFEASNKIIIVAGNGLVEINKGKIADGYKLISKGSERSEIGKRFTNIKANGLFKGEISGKIYVYGLFGAKYYENDTLLNILNNHEFVSKSITDIEETKDGLVWFASTIYGIVVKNGTQFQNVNTQMGLPSSFINSICVDKVGNIWAAHLAGISKISYQLVQGKLTFKITNFSQVDGLINKSINSISVSDDVIYAATEEGLCIFKEKDLRANTVKPILNIESIYFNEIVQKENSEYNSDYKSNSFKIKFVGIAFSSLGKLNYEYRMQGLEDNWKTTNSTVIEYSSLPPGEYVFQIRALNSNGIPSDTASIKVSIDPPFWKTWWFRIFVALALIYILYLIVNKRLKNIRNAHQINEQLLNLKNEKLESQRKQAIYEKELTELEHQALRLHMNPHFIFNAINSIQGFYASGEIEKAKLYISKFSGLLRMILDQSRKESIPISDELKIIDFYLEMNQLRFENKFTYNVEVDEYLLYHNFSIPPMLIQPFIENAIIHGIAPLKTEGKINIRIKNEGDYMLCEIEDNGVGRAFSEELNKGRIHTSTGIKVTQDRINLFNGNGVEKEKQTISILDLTDTHGKAAGTLIKFYVLKFE